MDVLLVDGCLWNPGISSSKEGRDIFLDFVIYGIVSFLFMHLCADVYIVVLMIHYFAISLYACFAVIMYFIFPSQNGLVFVFASTVCSVILFAL